MKSLERKYRYSRFSLKDVEEMEKLYMGGKTLTEIGKIYNIQHNNVSKLLKGKIRTSDGVVYKSRYDLDSMFLENKGKGNCIYNKTRSSRYSLKDVEEMEKLYMSGKTLTEIGKIYNISYMTVSNLIKGKHKTSDGIKYKFKYGFDLLENRNKRSRFSLKDVEEMEKLYLSGKSFDKIGNRYSISHSAVYNLINGKSKTVEGVYYIRKYDNLKNKHSKFS